MTDFAARNAQSIRDLQKPGLADLSQIFPFDSY